MMEGATAKAMGVIQCSTIILAFAYVGYSQCQTVVNLSYLPTHLTNGRINLMSNRRHTIVPCY